MPQGMHDHLNFTSLLLCSTAVSAQGTSSALTGIRGAPSVVIIGGVIGGVVVLKTVFGSIL